MQVAEHQRVSADARLSAEIREVEDDFTLEAMAEWSASHVGQLLANLQRLRPELQELLDGVNHDSEQRAEDHSTDNTAVQGADRGESEKA